NAGINARTQNTALRERISVCGRGVKIVHLELYSVHSDDIALTVAARGLLMQHFNRSLDDLILLLLIGVYQTVDVAVDVREIVQINPKQTPNQNEDWSDIIFPTAFASPVAD